MGKPQCPHLGRIPGMSRIDRVTADHEPAGARGADARQHLQQLALPVAGDARDADDLAGAQLQPDIVEQPHPPVVDQRQMFGAHQHVALPDGGLVEI